MTRGRLIAIEGIDGAGTTTQAQRLSTALAERGRATHLTREPSDGPIGKLLREMLAGEHSPVDATTMGLLFAADRADHLQREVEPALAGGTLVISDRWYHSSLAYQGTEEEREWIRELNRRARVPDLTIILDVAPERAARRRGEAGRRHEIYDASATQRRVAEGYRDLARALGRREPIVVLDGSGSADEVGAHVLAAAQRVTTTSES